MHLLHVLSSKLVPVISTNRVQKHTCKATFLASSGTEKPSCSRYLVSVMISASSGEKSTTYCRAMWEPEMVQYDTVNPSYKPMKTECNIPITKQNVMIEEPLNVAALGYSINQPEADISLLSA